MDALSQQASETLIRALEALLPEAWRHDPAVTLYPIGFSLQFTDAEGRRHMLEARHTQPDAPALVVGATLAYSYTHVDTTLDVDPILDQYRTTLTAIAAKEAELLPLLAATAPSPEVTPAPGTDAPGTDAPPAPAELAAILAEVLPESWRHDLTVTSWAGGFEVGFRDDGNHRHAFDVRRLSTITPAFVSGPALGFSYTMVDPGLDETAVLEKYRATLTALSGREAELLRWIDAPDAWNTDDNTEKQPAAMVAYPDQAPVAGALPARVTALLPEEWRHEVSVVSIRDGFAVGFCDAVGRRHMLEGRLVETGFPSLVRGKRFGFSYLKVDPALDESQVVLRYREVLQGFVAHEDGLAADHALVPR